MAKNNPFLKKAAADAKASARPVAKKHGLGRGLDSLIPSAPKAPQQPAVPPAPQRETTLELPILDIARSPWQPRSAFDENELAALAESLKNNGLVQPPVVRRTAEGKYELIAGERRLRAALLAGWKKIRVNVVDADDLTAATMTMTENLQREDLDPIEEAISYKTLQDYFALTQQEVSDRIGKGRATVANSVRLLELPDEVKQLVQNKLLSAGHAKLLLGVEGDKERILLARECVNMQIPVRVLERRLARRNAPPPTVREPPKSDLPDGYARTLEDALRRRLGCAVRLFPGATAANGRRIKGRLEIDFFDNSELDAIVRMIGATLD